MKYFIPLFFCFGLVLELSGQRFDIKFMFDGHQRECIIVKPTTPPPPGGYPVVFMLHGTSGDGEKFYNISGWKELGAVENFITVFPSSLSWCFFDDGVEKNNTKWVCGDLEESPCSGPPQNYTDDIGFLKKIVSLIHDTLPMNSSKIFACGFSNGCAMIHKLAMEAGDVFAAVAGSSGGLTRSDSVIPPLRRIPIWLMVGSLDDRFFVPPYLELPFGRDSILFYLQGIIKRTLACQELTQNFIFNETALSHTYVFNESQSGGLSNSPFLFTLNKGQTHQFPNGTNYPVDAPRVFWEFFKQSVTVATENKIHTKEQIEIYPNPSTDKIYLSIQNTHAAVPYQMTVMNAYGQVVFKQDKIVEHEYVLDKSRLGSGLFLIQIQKDNKTINRKILFE